MTNPGFQAQQAATQANLSSARSSQPSTNISADAAARARMTNTHYYSRRPRRTGVFGMLGSQGWAAAAPRLGTPARAPTVAP